MEWWPTASPLSYKSQDYTILKNILHRFYKGVIILAGIGIILLATLYLLRSVLIAPHIQRFLENSIESQLGMEVAIGNIGGSYITDFEVTNVTTLKPAPTGTLVSLELKRLRVAYNLLSILKGLNAFLGDAAVELETAKLEFDLSRQDASEPAPPEAESPPSIFLPHLLPQIRIHDTSVFLRGSDYETTFRGIALETRPPRQMTSIIQLRIAEWSWIHPDLQAGETPVSVEIEYSTERITAKWLMLGASELAESVQIGLKDLPGVMPFEAKLHLAGGRLMLDGKLDHSDLQARIKTDNIDLTPIGAFFSPPGLPLSGRLSMTADVLLPQLQPTDLVADLDLELTRGAIYGLAVDALDLRAGSKDGKLRLDQLDLRTGENLVEIRDLSISARPVFGADVAGILATVAGRFSLDCRDVPAFFSFAGADFSANIDAVPPHRLLLDGKVGEGNIILSRGSLTAESGHIRLHSNGQRITVETLELRQAKDRVDLKGSFDLKSRIFENVKLDIAIADLAAYTKNLFPQKQAINASIRANLKISGPLMEPEARADITLKEVQLNDFKIPSAIFKLHSSGRRIHIGLAKINTPLGEAKLVGNLLRGPADADFDLELTDLTLSGQNALMTLNKPGYVHFSRAGDLALKDISLSGPSGDIRLKGSLSARRNADLDHFVSDFGSHGWFESLLTDRIRFSGLNARIHLIGTMDNPSLSVVGDLAKLDSPKDRISLSGRFDLSYTKDGVLIRQFQWEGRPGQQITVTGTIPVNLLEKPLLRPGPLSVDARISIPDLAAFNFYYPDYIPSDGDLQAKLQMAGTWKAPSGTFIFRCRGLNDPPQLKSMPPGPIDIDGNIRLDGKKLVVESIQINSPRLTFTSRGEWTGMPALTDLCQGETAKPTGNVAVKGNLSVEDLSWLAAENPSLRRVSGRLEANVTMKGPISDPAVDAVVRLTDGELRPDMDVPSLQALNLNAVLTPDGAKLQTFTGELGGAAFNVTGSVMRNSQSGAVADLRLQGENLLFYRSAGLKVRADTDLTVKGPVKRLEVGGEVAITDGRLVKYFDLLSTLKGSAKPKTDLGLQLFSIRNPPISDMVFDVRLTSKNPFRIRNNLAKGAVRPELKLTGTGEFPVLSGEVYVDPTRITLPAGSLVFESGVIRFDPNRPDRPTLDLVGTSKMLGYDITMLVEGPYDEPVVTLSSVPPLSNEESLLLLIAGQQPSSTDDTQASQRQSMNVAVFLGRDLISRWFGSDSVEARESIIDRFEVAIGRAVTRAGEETIDAQFRIADGVLRDGDKLYITGEKDIFDFYNAGLKIVFRFK